MASDVKIDALQSTTTKSGGTGPYRDDADFAAITSRKASFFRGALARLAVLFTEELNAADPFVWFVVAFGLGVVGYFSLPSEPSIFALGIALALAVCGFLFFRNGAGGLVFSSATLAIIFGLLVPALHATLLPPPFAQTGIRTFEAHVANIEDRAISGARLALIDVTALEGDARPLPSRIRLTVNQSTFAAYPGDRVKVTARLSPASGPVVPGGYDFAKRDFFYGIEAGAFSLGAPQVVPASDARWNLSALGEGLRTRIADAIRKSFAELGSPDNGAIAKALLVGQRAAIDPDLRDTLARSGLAHMLAISGLHMALVVSAVILITRAMLAAVPSLALKAPIRSFAVVAGLSTGAFYFLISGGSVSATRAFIMVTIMAAALLFGARALSIRNLAIAALVILVISPSEIVRPGFQMSFAATLALIAGAVFFHRLQFHSEREPYSGRGPLRIVLSVIIGIALTSIIAGLATGLFAAFHFHRIAPFGLLANMIGIPIFSFLIMPFGFIAMVLMPFGLEAYAFAIMDFGISSLLAIASWVANIEPAMGQTGLLNRPAFLGLAACLVIFCLMTSQLRLLLIAPAVLFLPFLPSERLPLFFVAEDGRTVGIVHLTDDGSPRLVLSGKRAGRFEARVWRGAIAALPEEQTPAAPRFHCDRFACVASVDGLTISHVKTIQAFHEDCKRADIIVSRLTAPKFCENTAFVIDRRVLREGGAQMVFMDTAHLVGGGLAEREAERPVLHLVPAISQPLRPWHAHYSKRQD
ncbi:MAG: ComEC/Rec2 family competence protein [Pseudomonadota bacterium]